MLIRPPSIRSHCACCSGAHGTADSIIASRTALGLSFCPMDFCRLSKSAAPPVTIGQAKLVPVLSATPLPGTAPWVPS